ncbi:hypothetical protein [Thiosocius teredinicola]|uniref:hypothetical protein n=1 Tax=Thiosocius teredinicola TaxID=1973002 RepID=UPI000F788A62
MTNSSSMRFTLLSLIAAVVVFPTLTIAETSSSPRIESSATQSVVRTQEESRYRYQTDRQLPSEYYGGGGQQQRLRKQERNRYQNRLHSGDGFGGASRGGSANSSGRGGFGGGSAGRGSGGGGRR